MTTEAPQGAETGAPEGGQSTQEPTTGQEPKSLDAWLEKLDDEGRAAVRGALEKARSDAAGYRKRLKDAEGPLAEYQKLVDASKTEAERATERLTAAEAQAAAVTKRLVSAETRALAAGLFADPSDASHFLKPAENYLDADGEVDSKAIKADLDSVLKAKPHLAKTPERTGPAPDRSQGAGSGKPTSREARATGLQALLLGQ